MSPRLGFRSGGVWGLPVMKFTLHYDGPLPSSGNKPKPEAKWAIRRKIDPQLRDLWASHRSLKWVEGNRHFPKDGGTVLTQGHHLYPGPLKGRRRDAADPAIQEIIDLCEPIEKFGVEFRPLVRETYALHCGLKVTFLRKEAPGKVYQGGDMDGRIKTLLDALAMPQHKEQMIPEPEFSKSDKALYPIYCLLEDDSMISGFDIESGRLLSAHDVPSDDWVKLMIEVDVRVHQTTIYNQSFLG